LGQGGSGIPKAPEEKDWGALSRVLRHLLASRP
jgi:hypothetical protein